MILGATELRLQRLLISLVVASVLYLPVYTAAFAIVNSHPAPRCGDGYCVDDLTKQPAYIEGVDSCPQDCNPQMVGALVEARYPNNWQDSYAICLFLGLLAASYPLIGMVWRQNKPKKRSK